MNEVVTSPVTDTSLEVSVTSAYGGSGTAVSHSTASVSATLQNMSGADDLWYQVDSGAWQHLRKNQSVDLTINFESQTLKLKRGEFTSSSVPALVISHGVPSGLYARGQSLGSGGSVDLPALAALGVYPGGWNEETIDHSESAWADDGAGTWVFSNDVISQTDATADSLLEYTPRLPSLEYIVEAEIRFPTGQDAGVYMTAVVAARNVDQVAQNNTGTSNILGEGLCVQGQSAGDGAPISVGAWVDTEGDASYATSWAQGEWHKVRVCCSPVAQMIWLDGTYIGSDEKVTGGNTGYPQVGPPILSCDKLMLATVGKADFRNVKVWTQVLP